MTIHRLTNTFSSGELSPLMYDRVDFKRRNSGCKILENMTCTVQGPVRRRSGFAMRYDLDLIGIHPIHPVIRMVPFIFNELQSYAMIFYTHASGRARIAFAYGDGLVASGGSPVTLTLPPGWDIEKFDYAQSADELYIAQPGMRPHIIRRNSHTNWQVLAVTFTDQPSVWSTGHGWPERVTFHQQRLVFAATKIRRQTVWMSKAGDFSDFGKSSPLLDSDAVTFTLDSGTQNKIVWLNSAKSLHIGTIGNEWTVVGNNRAALTPSNILAQRQTNRGSEPITPLMIGVTTLFIERHGRKINEFVYDYTYDNYKTSDVSVLSPHITEKTGIVDWTYQQTPDSVIWCVLESGELAGLTYEREHNVIAWHRHTTQGRFKAITSIPGVHSGREDTVWAVIERTINGASRYYVEKQAKAFTGNAAHDGRFLDSYLRFTNVVKDQTVTLAHLPNTEVDILIDGAVYPTQTVTTGPGLFSVTVPADGDVMIVGLRYNSRVQPLLQDLQTSKDGTSLGRVKRINRLAISLYKSLGMYIGRYDSYDGLLEDELAFRLPTDPTNTEVPLISNTKRVNFIEGFDVDDNIVLTQRQPLPMTIRSITDFVEVFE